MRAGAVGRGVAAAVARRHRHLQPGAGIQAVLGLDFQAERIPLVAVRGAAEQHRAGVLADDGPRQPVGQAVDGVRPGGLGEGQLVFGAAEGIAPAVDPVRPGRQQLARSGRRKLVRFVARDHRLAVEGQLAQSGAEFGHRGAVMAGLNLVLQSGKRNDHGVRIRTKAAPRGSLPPDPGEIDALGCREQPGRRSLERLLARHPQKHSGHLGRGLPLGRAVQQRGGERGGPLRRVTGHRGAEPVREPYRPGSAGDGPPSSLSASSTPLTTLSPLGTRPGPRPIRRSAASTAPARSPLAQHAASWPGPSWPARPGACSAAA